MFHKFLGFHLIISAIVGVLILIYNLDIREPDYKKILRGYLTFEILLLIGEFGLYLII